MNRYFFASLALLITLCSCSEPYIRTEGAAWGTMYHIIYKSDVNLEDSIQQQLESIDNSFSLFNPDSELCRFNAGETDSVSPEFIEVFLEASAVNRSSGGVFDPTIAPLVALWGFGAEDISSQPDSAAVDSALHLVGMNKCSIDGNCISRPHPGTRLDFSALAKGYGIDCIGRMLERNGCSDYLVEIGGEVLVKGLNPDGKPWRIQIDSPENDAVSHNGLTIITMGPQKEALASSGNYRNFRTDSAGIRYGHTIDPRTGYPIQLSTVATSIRADNCMEADAYATASMLMEPDSALSMLNRAGLQGLLVIIQNDTLTTSSTSSFFR